MLIRWIVLALVLSGANAYAYTGCSDATGANRYEDNNYRGGIPPQPTTVVDDVKIYMGGTLASESTTLYNQTSTAGPLIAVFDSSSTNLLDSYNDGFVKDYTIRMSVQVANSNGFNGPTPPVFIVLCHQDNSPVP